jgi:hypothetical protein
VWYDGSNQPRHSPNRSTDPARANQKRGQGRFGYRAREENYSAALLLQLSTFYPDLCVDTVAGDSGFGYDVFLSAVYNHLHARRAIDLSGHESDKDKAEWLVRRYDDKGRPLCAYGYALTANGFDSKRRRSQGQGCHFPG